MRRAFLAKVSEMIKNEPDTTFFTVDFGMWALQEILNAFPERAMNFGICEDGMISIAAGMAMRGLIPTIFGIEPYIIERALEQIKLDLAYQKQGVNLVGTGASVDYPKYGYSHYCAEDLGILKMIPGIEFIAPGTPNQFRQLFDKTYRNGNTTYYRVSDHPNKFDCDVFFGKANVIQKGTKAVVIAVSVMLDAVLEACGEEDVTILYYTTLEPFDRETLKENFNTGKILVCEPHFEGSLIFDIYKSLNSRSLQIECVGFPREIFRNYGTYEEKMDYYGLNPFRIKEKLNLLLMR